MEIDNSSFLVDPLTLSMRFAILFVLLSVNLASYGQLNTDFSFRHFGHMDGVLHPSIQSISQDQYGYIWILTENGLQRFDGKQFISYPVNNDTALIHFAGAEDLYIDSVDHRILIGKSTAYSEIDLLTNTITSHSALDYFREQIDPDTCSYLDDQGNQWIITEFFFADHVRGGQAPSSYYLNNYPYQPQQAKYFVRDERSRKIWTYHDGYLVCTDPVTKSLQKVLAIKKDFNGLGCRFFFIDHQQYLWISTWNNTFYRYHPASKELVEYSLTDIKAQTGQRTGGDKTLLINAFFEDRQKNLWIATDNAGLLAYDRHHNTFQAYYASAGNVDGIQYNFQVKCLYQDRDDNLWVGTDRGINVFNPYRDLLRVIRHEETATSLPNNDITDVMQISTGEILVSTWGGGITFYDSNWTFLRNVQFNAHPSQNLVWSFAEQADGMVWAGTQNGFIHQYDLHKKTFTTIRPDEVAGSTIITMSQDRHGITYLGLNSGKIVTWDPLRSQFISSGPANDDPQIYSPVSQIFFDSQDRCWVGTASGLKEFDPTAHSYIRTLPAERKSTGPAWPYTVKGIAEFNDSVLIIGTEYSGLYLIDKRSGSATPYACCGNTNPAIIGGIGKDARGGIWFTTKADLVNVDPLTGAYTAFTTGQTVMHDFFYTPCFRKLRDGRWVTFSYAELICFNPLDMRTNHRIVNPVQISDFVVRDQRLYLDSFLLRGTPIELKHRQNFIAIHFSALDFNALGQLAYAYRLSDVNEDWIVAGSRQYAEYTDLKPGSYVFEVKAENGLATSPVTTIAFEILPPWWATWWFRTLAVSVVAAVILIALRKRIQLIRKEAALKHRMAESEMMALRAQMNPHFIFNCINSIDAMIQQDDKYRATTYLNKFARLIRNVLDISRENSVPLSKDMETLQLYLDLEMFRHAGQFTVRVKADPELLQGDYKVPPLIIQPYVENAILHGLRGRQEGMLTIDVRREAGKIIYCIEDNGTGRRSMNGNGHHASKGIGMQLSSDRVRLFNQEEQANVEVIDLMNDGQPSGTRVVVQLNAQE